MTQMSNPFLTSDQLDASLYAMGKFDPNTFMNSNFAAYADNRGPYGMPALVTVDEQIRNLLKDVYEMGRKDGYTWPPVARKNPDDEYGKGYDDGYAEGYADGQVEAR